MIFRVYLHQQWETSQMQLAGTETNIKEVPSSLKTNLPQLLPPQSVSKGQNRLTISMTNEQDVSTAHPRTETTPEDPIDHTRQYFKIMYCVMIGNTVVDEDTEKVRLGEFIYRQFDVQAIKNIDKAASKAHCGSNGSPAML